MADKVITIAAFNDTLKAELSKGRLEDAGVECFLTNDAGYNLYGYNVGRISLQIKESDSAKALEILGDNE